MVCFFAGVLVRVYSFFSAIPFSVFFLSVTSSAGHLILNLGAFSYPKLSELKMILSPSNFYNFNHNKMPPGPHAFKSPKADSIPASVLQILKRPSLTQSFSSDPSPPSRPLSPTPALASTPTPIPAPPQRAPAATAPQPPSSPKLSSATTTLDPPYHPTAPVTPRFTHQTLAVSTRTPTTPTTPRLTFHTLTVTSIPRPAILPTPGFTPLSLHLPPVTPLTPTLLNLTTPPTPPTVTGPQFAVLHEPRITATAAMSLYPAATAGSQLDLNHLWQQVQELSALLAQNRESAQGLVKRADEIRVCP